MDEDVLVAQADEAALLQMEAWTLGLHDPAIWERYVEAWTSNVERRISDHFESNRSQGGIVTG